MGRGGSEAVKQMRREILGKRLLRRVKSSLNIRCSSAGSVTMVLSSAWTVSPTPTGRERVRPVIRDLRWDREEIHKSKNGRAERAVPSRADGDPRAPACPEGTVPECQQI